jgi:hypothetical protein
VTLPRAWPQSNDLRTGRGSWDFDGSVSTSAKNRTRRSPMSTHETSPVSGASVMGMTTRVGQGRSHLSVDIPGISVALDQRGRFQLKGRLLQQPAGDFTEESPSRRRRRNSSNGRFAKSGLASTRSIDAGHKRDATTLGLHQSAGETVLYERIQGKAEGICLEDAGPGGKGTL